MKNMLPVFFLLPLFSILKSQDYMPMAVDGAHWIVFSITDDGFSHHFLTIKGDTSISGVFYKKIYRQEIESTASSPQDFLPPYVFNTEHLFGFMRDDVNERKVYGRFLNSIFECHPSEESMLYDFSLEMGDTIGGCINILPFHDQATIDSVTYSFLWGNDRKVIHLNEPGDRMIEGVGTTLGPFMTILGEVHPGSPVALIDYCIGTDVECGLQFTPTKEFRNDWKINVYPNPAQEYLTIELPEDMAFPLNIQIHDLTGKLLLEKTIDQKKMVEMVNTASFPKGIFTFQFQNENGLATKRFVKN